MRNIIMYSRASNGDGQYAAFTIAEVLITLVIIGVIAAITIPNLMQKYARHERATQVKTAYSIIQNAVKMSIAENGSPDGWDYDRSPQLAERYILPYLKVQHVCGSSNGFTPKRHDCFKDDGQNGNWYYINGNTAAGSQSGYGSDTFYNAKLQNGMDFGVWGASKQVQQSHGHHVIYFVFDVNGRKGATKLGNDVFAFGMDTNFGKVRTLGFGCGSVERACIGGQTDINSLLTQNYSFACNANSSGQWSGFSCARVLELNHWTFPDNYPIKKF